MHQSASGILVQADGLSRRFGDHLAVDNVSFDIGRGEIFGFLGPNGAGKSTTARMLTGFVRPTSGRAVIAGLDLAKQPSRARRYIGVVPEEANAYADLTVQQNVLLMSELHGMAKSQRLARTDELLHVFDLYARRAQKGRDLSKGLRQRLMLCMALVSDPQVLFLDEPTSGLDVASAHLIRKVIQQMNRDRQMTVFVTTHNMDEAEQLCHRVAIINQGKLAAIDTPAALRGRVASMRSVDVRFTQVGVRAEDLLSEPARKVISTASGFQVFDPNPGRVAQEIASRATALGLTVESLCTRAPSLEEVFLSITTGATDAAAQ
ncbi:ABC transporter ATP-binding protein [Piscinibacter sp.]|jgi:ABC-2 type transport system ATP-binding protein|uniref:ABC transporter ATP-binding protein n=1 Tax=Piscinibacter sp. TaxID=1903157 RepID=UPI00355A9B11